MAPSCSIPFCCSLKDSYKIQFALFETGAQKLFEAYKFDWFVLQFVLNITLHLFSFYDFCLCVMIHTKWHMAPWCNISCCSSLEPRVTTVPRRITQASSINLQCNISFTVLFLFLNGFIKLLITMFLLWLIALETMQYVFYQCGKCWLCPRKDPQ